MKGGGKGRRPRRTLSPLTCAALCALLLASCALDLQGRLDLPPDTAAADESAAEELSPADGEQAADAGESEEAPEADGCDAVGTWCGEDGLWRCDQPGAAPWLEPCAHGCAPDPLPHCREIAPSNIGDPNASCPAGVMNLSVAEGTRSIVVDTDTGAILQYSVAWIRIEPDIRSAGEGMREGIRFEKRAQGEGEPPLGVFVFNSFVLPAGIDLFARGSRALVVLSCTDIEIHGVLRAGGGELPDGSGALSFCAGPAGAAPGKGAGAGAPAPAPSGGVETGGGGGGGNGGVGGQGGIAAGGKGGGASGTPALVPLVGGSGGGAGAVVDGSEPGEGEKETQGGEGGGGGGAVELSARGAMRVTGTIEASGRGGKGGAPYGGGGGGGSGGSILLEAASVTIEWTAFITANGGGGGSGGGEAGGADGSCGGIGTAAARGGEIPGLFPCSGGAGNGADFLDGRVGTCGTWATDGGGGGGGAGRIRINSLAAPAIAGILSPYLQELSTTTVGAPDLR